MKKIILIGNIIENSSFWSSLFSSFIIAGIVGIFLPSYLSYINKPKKFVLFFIKNGNNNIVLNTESTTNLNYDFELAFRHLSGKSFNHSIYWHLYIPEFINPKPQALGPNTLPIEKKEKTEEKVFIHFSGTIPGPIFTGTTHWFHYKFSGTFKSNIEQIKNDNKITLYYFISTEYGNFPKKIKRDINTGMVNIKTANKLFLNIPA